MARTIAQHAIRQEYRRIQIAVNADTVKRGELKAELAEVDGRIAGNTSNLLALNEFIAKQKWDAKEVLGK